MIYLKGTKSADVEAVLKFIYQGEVNIEQANLETFLEVAEDLEVKGLVPGKDHVGSSNMQSPLLTRTNMQYPASKITRGKQTSHLRCNSQSSIQTYGQSSAFGKECAATSAMILGP